MNFFSDYKNANIPLDEIDYDGIYKNSKSRYAEEVGIEELAEHIEKNGLIEPIVVSPKNKSDKRIVYEGKRRALAYRYLNKKNPKKGFDKIICFVTKEILTSEEEKVISLGSGLTSLPFTLEDAVDGVDELFKIHNDAKIVAKKTGISVRLIKKYVKFARLPKLLRDNLTTIDKNPKAAMTLAIEATDILNWFKDGDVPPEKVLELAKKLGEKKRKSQEEYRNMKEAAEENSKLSIDEIEKIAATIRHSKKYVIMLSSEAEEKLAKAAEEQGMKPAQFMVDLVEDGLDRY